MKIKNYIIGLLTVLLSFLSCAKNDSKPSSLSVKIIKVQSFCKAEGNENEILGLPSDIAIDKNGNLYICDYSFKKVKKYSPNGEFVKSFGLGEGQGPGEFSQPRSIDVDLNDNLYVVDMNQRSITMFDSASHFIKRIMINLRPFSVVATSPKNVYIVGNLHTYNGDLVYKYDFTKNGEKPVTTFCKRYNGKYIKKVIRIGSPGEIAKYKNENIFQIAPYPYEIKKFSLNGQLLQTMYGDFGSNKSNPIMEDKVYNQIVPYYSVSSPRCTFLNDSIFIILIEKVKRSTLKKKWLYFLDFWNIKNNSFLGRISEEDLGLKLNRSFKADGAGNIYLLTAEPYPHIEKYKLILSFKK